MDESLVKFTDSIFYFKNDVNFICSLWDNLYNL